MLPCAAVQCNPATRCWIRRHSECSMPGTPAFCTGDRYAAFNRAYTAQGRAKLVECC